jgi:hypothetical protein
MRETFLAVLHWSSSSKFKCLLYFFDHYIQSSSAGIVLFLRSLHHKGEVIGFRLFRATGLAFAIRRKDGVIMSGGVIGFRLFRATVMFILALHTQPPPAGSSANERKQRVAA